MLHMTPTPLSKRTFTSHLPTPGLKYSSLIGCFWFLGGLLESFGAYYRVRSQFLDEPFASDKVVKSGGEWISSIDMENQLLGLDKEWIKLTHCRLK